MPRGNTGFPAPSGRTELIVLLLVSAGAFAAVPLALGGIGLGWDALNHHVYLGWIADELRFDRDFQAASGQSTQYPYLYWPLYKLVSAGWSGPSAGVLLVLFNLVAVPPLWMLARAGVPEASWYGVAMRWLAVALAFLTGVVLSLFDSTSNDLLAAIPLVWAIALAIAPLESASRRRLPVRRTLLLSGLCAGAAVAFKFSNGPLALVLPLAWCAHGPGLRQRLVHVAWGCAATVAGFALFYGWWGWQLWTHYGNPLYPFCENWFGPLRAYLGWQP